MGGRLEAAPPVICARAPMTLLRFDARDSSAVTHRRDPSGPQGSLAVADPRLRMGIAAASNAPGELRQGRRASEWAWASPRGDALRGAAAGVCACPLSVMRPRWQAACLVGDPRMFGET